MLRAMNVLDADAMRASGDDGGYCPYLEPCVLIRISRCPNLSDTTIDPSQGIYIPREQIEIEVFR
jgi:hypothetical protein